MRHPGERLREQSQRLDDLDIRLRKAIELHTHKVNASLENAKERLYQHTPLSTLSRLSTLQQQLEQRLTNAINADLDRKKRLLASRIAELDAYSPLATLLRGYSILQDKEGAIVSDASQTQSGDKLKARLGKGTLECTVDQVNSVS